jgi:hypothetical protein
MGVKKGVEKRFVIHDLLGAVILIGDMLTDEISLV